MSLLMLKTRDLTWQDHTLNTEAMLAPARSVLLLNKHKTLGAKCHSDKQLFERQRVQCLKDFLSSRRIIDRQRQKLIQKQRELGTKEQRVRSAVEPASASASGAASTSPSSRRKSHEGAVSESKERSSSAPGGMNRTLVGLPTIYIDTGTRSPQNPPHDDDDDNDSDASGFFVTDMPSSSSTPLPVLAHLSIIPAATPTSSSPRHRSIPGRPQPPAGRSSRHAFGAARPTNARHAPNRSHASPSFSQSGRREGRGHAAATSPSRGQGPRLSVRFADDRHDNNRDPHRHHLNNTNTTANVHLGQKEPLKDPSLQAKVEVFIDDIHQFTEARRLGQTAKTKPDLWPGVERKQVKSPLVAKRYNSWHVDQAELLAVFDKFCNVQSIDELTKTKRVAAKLNASVKLTRNQSIVPSIATFKSTRAFKSLLDRNN